jgi:hypothetical protein
MIFLYPHPALLPFTTLGSTRRGTGRRKIGKESLKNVIRSELQEPLALVINNILYSPGAYQPMQIVINIEYLSGRG